MRYIVEAEVIRGQQLGREMGFPTANMDIAERTDIENGVYRSFVEVDGRDYLAMSNVGVRPSVDGKTRLLETHLFGYCGNLYGRRLRVRLSEKIRDERKFASIDDLKAQLAADRLMILGGSALPQQR